MKNRHPELISGSLCCHEHVHLLMKPVIWDFSATPPAGGFGRNDIRNYMR